MGAPNAQGIYVYDETDKAAPVSTLLNKLGTSITTVVTALKSRLTALETAQPVAVINGRYTASVVNAASSTVVPVGAISYVTAGSSTPAGTLWVRINNGWTFKKRGTYIINVAFTTNIVLSGRVFVNVNVGTESFRIPFTATGEDGYSGAASIVVPSDDTIVTLAVFHATGAARTFTIRADIVRLGTLT
ncbi:hypothetical protein KXS11_03470 [Plantibacter flavus]|uniref:hypothetical protein n=1 Tax=Plantibacter flavus TaxID=150123 RepID=UPI003F13A8FA